MATKVLAITRTGVMPSFLICLANRDRRELPGDGLPVGELGDRTVLNAPTRSCVLPRCCDHAFACNC
jgi:hypothetical protein